MTNMRRTITSDFVWSASMVYLIFFMVTDTSARVLLQEENSLSTNVSQRSENNVSQIFEDWIQEHKRVYTTKEEKDRRFAIFEQKYQFLEDFQKGNETLYTIGLNKFSDMTAEEFSTHYGCVSSDKPISPSAGISTSSRTAGYLDDPSQNKPCDGIDWSERGVLTPVRSQYHCGSCYAMAAVLTVEAIYRIKGENVPPLSVQQIVDCDARDMGCAGGSAMNSYQYIAENGGIVPEENYQYDRFSNTSGKCASREKHSLYLYDIDDYYFVYPQTKAALEKAVCRQPVSTVVRSSSVNFNLYKGGIFQGVCDGPYDHVLTIVGFGTDANGIKYWKIQNSWGPDWGEGGFMRLIRGDDDKEKTGHCGIGASTAYPTVDID